MKFAATALSVLAFASTALAGTFYSPAPGETLKRGGTFNLTFDSGHYFKESGIAVSAALVLSSTWNEGNSTSGANLIKDWPTNKTFAPYSSNGISEYIPVQTLDFESSDSANYTLVVFDHYNAYKGIDATGIWTQSVVVASA